MVKQEDFFSDSEANVKKMIIFFAELSHTGYQRSPNTVPLASGYLAAYCKNVFPDLDITIFRDPNQLLEAIKTKKPDIVSFSIYVWSENLSSYCAKKIKKISNKTVIVVGGASVDDVDSELIKLLKNHPYYDLCIPNEGEISFHRLIEYLKEKGQLLHDETIAGCARLSSDGSLLRGQYEPPELSILLSPYLTGLLDQFLQDGYEPIIQSMRGCPYSCAFCISGTSKWSKLRAFDLARVYAEFEYIKKRTGSKLLMLTDENFGILGDRDVQLAEFIMESHNKFRYPNRLYYYSAKITTDYVLKIVEILSSIGEYTISFQTLNEVVRKDIRRTNIKYDRFLEYIEWANRRHIVSSTEMIFGFSGETKKSYIAGLEQLLHSGVNRIYSYNLRLFSGIDLSTESNRKKYHFKTKFRLPERTFGTYAGEVITEVEEVVVGTDSFTFEDYLSVRKYGLFLELSSGRGYLSELIKILIKFGLPGERIVTFLTERSFETYPRLASIIEEYTIRSKEELYETTDDCTRYIRELIAKGIPIPEVKLNFVFTGKIMLDEKVRNMFFEVVKEFIITITSDKKQIDFFIDYIDNVLSAQIVSFHPDEKRITRVQSRIQIDNLLNNRFDSIEDLMNDTPLSIELLLHDDANELIQKKPLCDLNESALQDIYMSVSRFGLMRLPRAKNDISK